MARVKTPRTHRERQALQTRDLITETAQQLFLERGYAATTIDAIAERAGVAVSTVYAAFKSKRGLLQAIRARWHQASQVRETYAEANRTADPQRRLALYARATRRQWETSAAMIRIFTGAAAADPEAAAELRDALEGRRREIGTWLAASAPLLRQDLTLPELQATYLALTRSEVYQELVDTWGWSADAYEAWLARTLAQQLLP